MKHTTWSSGLCVSADGTGVVAHAGTIAVRLLAYRSGLTKELSKATARRSFLSIHDRGQVLVDVAVMLADGGEAIGDINVLRHRLGTVPLTGLRDQHRLGPARRDQRGPHRLVAAARLDIRAGQGRAQGAALPAPARARQTDYRRPPAKTANPIELALGQGDRERVRQDRRDTGTRPSDQHQPRPRFRCSTERNPMPPRSGETRGNPTLHPKRSEPSARADLVVSTRGAASPSWSSSARLTSARRRRVAKSEQHRPNWWTMEHATVAWLSADLRERGAHLLRSQAPGLLRAQDT